MLRAGCAWLMAGLAGAWAQPAPSINPNGVVNAASSAAGAVAPGSIASVYGSFLLTSASQAQQVPLPTNLGGLSLDFGTVGAPLFYASSGQVNLQVPWEAAGETQAPLTASLAGQAGEPQSAAIAPFAPGIFAMNSQGSGQGAILDTTYKLVTPSNPAAPGLTTIFIFCTGLGAVSHQPATGAAAPFGPLAETTTQPTVTIGGMPAQVSYSGLAPGTVGEYQVNALVPAGAPIGDAVPVMLSIGGVSSNTVQIAVQYTPDQRAAQLVAQMTQDEKIQLVYGAGGPVTNIIPLPRGAAGYVPGIARLGIPDPYLADGRVGVGTPGGPATALPSSNASAASWDVNEAYKYGTVIGTELRAYGMNVNLGGNINLIGREPRDGRTFETKGEDPMLAGKIAAAHINAIQAQHVIGGIKHYALNDQETDRTTADVQIDERGMRESDLLAFEIGVKDSNVQSVMCSYNLVNSVYACENAHLLNDVLKGSWQFPGFVMSDWWATHSTVAAALAGLDQEQPDNQYFGTLAQAVAAGQVPQARLDDMAQRILRAMYAAGLFDYPEQLAPIDTATDQAIAQEAEEQGAVLLKNAGGLLPLDAATVKSIAVIGSHADIAVLSGGGSAQVIPTGGPALTEGYPNPPGWAQVIWDPSSPLQAIQAMAPGATVQFDDGTNAASAAALAAGAQTAIVFVSQWTSEGMDLPSLNFTDVIHAPPVDQDALVAAVAAANPRTIVVMENGGPQVMPWLASVGAVLEAWFPGQRGGPAIADLLFGAVNPSGKLPVTFPASVNDLPRPAIASGSTPFPVNYSEGFNVGYKWYDSQGLTPLFPFGFGLSYTTFSLTNAKVEGNAQGFLVSCTLTNTGGAAGAEVAQVYLAFPAATGEPPRRLVGWQKIYLQPGASQLVTITVNSSDSSHPLSYWDVNANAWLVAPGTYTVYLGNSSAGTSLMDLGPLEITTLPGGFTARPPRD